MSGWERAAILLGAGAGLAGTVLSAAAAHRVDAPALATAAQFLLFHAPVLLATAALLRAGLVGAGLGRAATLLFGLGLALFCGDLAARALAGAGLFRFAAPTGGTLLMAAWILLAGAALVRPERGQAASSARSRPPPPR